MTPCSLYHRFGDNWCLVARGGRVESVVSSSLKEVVRIFRDKGHKAQTKRVLKIDMLEVYVTVSYTLKARPL